MAFAPVLMEHPLTRLQVTATTPADLSQYEWDGYVAVGQAPPRGNTEVVRFWRADEYVATGAIRMSPAGKTLVRIVEGTTRPDFDGTELSSWSISSGGTGGGGSSAQTHVQNTASATWSITHGLGRLPAVDLYVGGQQVEADVAATSTTVSVTFPSPTAGIAVLT